MCSDPSHHAYKSGPRVGRITGWLVIVLGGALMSFCPRCWSGRVKRAAAAFTT